jgi:hypothetical protein
MNAMKLASTSKSNFHFTIPKEQNVLHVENKDRREGLQDRAVDFNCKWKEESTEGWVLSFRETITLW